MGFKSVLVDYLGNLSEILSGDTIHPDQLGTGTRDGSKVLRDDGTWVAAGEGAVYTGDKTVIGSHTSDVAFITTIDHTLAVGYDAAIYVDASTGVDGLTPYSYLGATISTGNRFQTLKAAIEWTNKVQLQNVVIYGQGTSAGSRLTLGSSDSLALVCKGGVIIRADTGTLYLQLDGRIQSERSLVSFTSCDIACGGTSPRLSVSGQGELKIVNTAIAFSATSTTCISVSDGKLFLRGATFNFSANNQTFIRSSGTGGAIIQFSNDTPACVFNISTYTGIKWAETGRSNQVYMSSATLPTIPSGIDMSEAFINYSHNVAIKQTVFDPTSVNYALSLGGTKPLKFLDLSSSSPNLAYTTKKKLIINELKEIGVMDDTGGTVITSGTAVPTGGSDGDIYLQYT